MGQLVRTLLRCYSVNHGFIYLRVGGIEVDWRKNHARVDHNALFQPGYFAEVPYYHIDRQSEAEPDEPGEVVETEEGYRWKLITEQREGYSRPRRTVIDRIEMLGYTEAYSRREFAYLARRNGLTRRSSPTMSSPPCCARLT